LPAALGFSGSFFWAAADIFGFLETPGKKGGLAESEPNKHFKNLLFSKNN
jgi:hypothetical protein